MEACVTESDRDAVVDALLVHVDRTGQPDYKRPSKVSSLADYGGTRTAVVVVFFVECLLSHME